MSTRKKPTETNEQPRNKTTEAAVRAGSSMVKTMADLVRNARPNIYNIFNTINVGAEKNLIEPETPEDSSVEPKATPTSEDPIVEKKPDAEPQKTSAYEGKKEAPPKTETEATTVTVPLPKKNPHAPHVDTVDEATTENPDGYVAYRETYAKLMEQLNAMNSLVLDVKQEKIFADKINGLLEELLIIFAMCHTGPDIPLDYRNRKQLETIESELKQLWLQQFPGESPRERNSLLEIGKIAWAGVARGAAKISIPSRYSIKHPLPTDSPHEKRNELSQLLNDIQSAKKNAHSEFRKGAGAVAGLLAFIGAVDWMYESRSERLAEDLARQVDVIDGVTVLKVEDRKVTVQLPYVPQGMEVFAYAAPATDRLGKKFTEFDPKSGVIQIPDSIQPTGGAVDIYFEAKLPDTNATMSLYSTRVENISALKK